MNLTNANNKTTCLINISTNFSSDAKFFVATGVLAMLYSIGIMVVYAKMDEKYKTNNQLPMIVKM